MGRGLDDGVEQLGLSPRETAVAKARLRGETVLGTAHVLSISANTVRTHIRRIYRKLKISGVVELARAAQKARQRP